MRILYLTSGTGSFYCGSCMRDNALVKELRALGHDATMLPLYMPLTLDEDDASAGMPVMMGGVNAFLQQKSALFRHTPRWIDQIFDSPKMLAAAGKRAGATSPKELGDITLSMIRGELGKQVKEIDRLAQWTKENMKPDMICLSNALLLGVARRLRQEFNVPIVCCFQGEDSFVNGLDEPFKTQTWQTMRERALECEALVSISHYYADTVAEKLKLPKEKFQVVYNGINLDGFAPAPSPPEHPTLGFFARNCPAKGLHTLVDAFLLLKQRQTLPDLTLRVAGTRAAGDENFVEQQQSKIMRAGFENDAQFLPPLTRDEKIKFLQGLSVLSVPATYGEAFGLYLIEAWACGVPVAQPKIGAFTELVGETGGGVLCEADSALALADAIEKLLSNPKAAREVGEHARQMTEKFFSAKTMAVNFEKVLQAI